MCLFRSPARTNDLSHSEQRYTSFPVFDWFAESSSKLCLFGFFIGSSELFLRPAQTDNNVDICTLIMIMRMRMRRMRVVMIIDHDNSSASTHFGQE